MNIQNPSVKIFVKNDGSKVIDISLIDYISEKKDANGNSIPKLDSYGMPEVYTNNKGEQKEAFETETKGYRLKFEFTNDGWKTKKIIYLQDKEVVEVIAVLSGKQKECKFQRDKKTLVIQYQGTHSFITFNQDGEKFYGKSTLFTSLNIVTFGLTLLSRELYRLQGLKFTPDILLKEIEYLTGNLSIGNENIQNKEPQNENIENENPIENVSSENQEHSSTCADCGAHLDPIKHGKIIEFSNKKYKRTVCYNCQQKLK